MVAPPASVTPGELVARCLRGDEAAWGALVDRYARLVYAVGVRHGLTPPEVEDIAQETFLALARTLHTLDDPERLPSWLMTTARRLCWRAVQKRRQEQLPEGADLSESEPATGYRPLFDAMPSMDELAHEWHRQEMLAAGMARLGDRCRTLLRLLFLDRDEPSYDTIAAQTGTPKGSIGPTRIRCLQQLRQILEGLGFGQIDA